MLLSIINQMPCPFGLERSVMIIPASASGVSQHDSAMVIRRVLPTRSTSMRELSVYTPASANAGVAIVYW